ncbi:hypothetical protein [Geodermatophilus sp. TF02-6]|uniref:hypothetical protein n=1 Tax=Geodermatophilus sp. TF02-6 TaxID=2250575 RepID=UPI0018F3EE72|nr:hypothetical protein [Geodermatophilus sp. TF02-6]
MDDRGLQRDRFPRTIDRESSTPAYLTLIANAWSSGNSVFYMHRYGIGVNDWRVLSTLANHPGATAVEVCGVRPAHIDLELCTGTVCQYSLCGDPGNRSVWRIAVLRDPAGAAPNTCTRRSSRA